MADEIKVGDIVEAKVFRITSFGAFVRLAGNKKGLIHISQVADSYVKDIKDHMKVGDRVKARVVSIKEGKVDLTLKKEKPAKAAASPQGSAFRSNLMAERLGEFLNNNAKEEKPDKERQE